jgi:hypothetical protein
MLTRGSPVLSRETQFVSIPGGKLKRMPVLVGSVCAAGFEPALPATSTPCLLPVGLRAHESSIIVECWNHRFSILELKLKLSHHADSNRGPALYESAALPSELWRQCLSIIVAQPTYITRFG